MKIELGRTYKDKITGFTGVATGIVSYITGCDQVLLTPKAKGGEHKSGQWADVNRLSVTKAKKIVIETSKDKGAMDAPPTY